jgi:hypothetical protein
MQRHLLTLAALCAVSPSFLLMPDGGGGGGGACLNTLGLPKWQSHKTVWAGKVAAVSEKEGIPSLILDLGDDQTNIAVGQAWLDRHKPEVGGYFVLYADGYRSYSPAKAFEEGHTLARASDHVGEMAYAAFCAQTGTDFGPWAELRPDVQRGWNAAARAVASEVSGTMQETAAELRRLDEARTLCVQGAFPIPADNPEHVMRAKLRASRVSPTPDKDAGGSQTVDFNAVGPSQYPDDGSDENNSFAKWSPSASMSIMIANPKLFGVIFPGDEFYVDFTLAKKGERPEPPPADVQPGVTAAIPEPAFRGGDATITHLAAKDAAGNDVPTPQNDDVPPGGPVPTPETAEAPKS